MSRFEVCSCCDGEGYIKIKDKDSEECPECFGTGTVKALVKLPFKHFPTYKDGGRK